MRALAPAGRQEIAVYLVHRYGSLSECIVGGDLEAVGGAVALVLGALGAPRGEFSRALDGVLDDAPNTWTDVIESVQRTMGAA